MRHVAEHLVSFDGEARAYEIRYTHNNMGRRPRIINSICCNDIRL